MPINTIEPVVQAATVVYKQRRRRRSRLIDPAASWESGYPSDCKSAYSGSIPDEASSVSVIVANNAGNPPEWWATAITHCCRFATQANKMSVDTPQNPQFCHASHIFAQLLQTFVWQAKQVRCIHWVRVRTSREG